MQWRGAVGDGVVEREVADAGGDQQAGQVPAAGRIHQDDASATWFDSTQAQSVDGRGGGGDGEAVVDGVQQQVGDGFQGGAGGVDMLDVSVDQDGGSKAGGKHAHGRGEVVRIVGGDGQREDVEAGGPVQMDRLGFQRGEGGLGP